MTPKEELIQAIERSPDEVVQALLELLTVLQRQPFAVERPIQSQRVLEQIGRESQPMNSGEGQSDRHQRTWQFCGRFAIAESASTHSRSRYADLTVETNDAEQVDAVLYQGF
ncbi:hypothetical protein GS601_22575 [Myxacorys almedinensis A]|uniref:Uncharacterized protein n=2 Tax=Myxacorys TaxID=2056239 RepID=A0A8J8CPU5_9CYAN|nr:hypothetical protein [Myxacorys almedinensis A]